MIYVTHDQIEALTLADRIAVMRRLEIQQLGSPGEIYHRPANLFVAGFVGSPRMNFIDGRLEPAADGFAFVTGDRRLPLEGYDFRRRPEAGAPVTLGIRPEHLAPEGDGACRLEGLAVEMIEPMGADSLVWCGDGRLSLGVRMPGERPVALGAPLPLGISPRQLSLFAQEDGARL
jgi:multiple sugar transport system ATP-binding protein